MGVMVGSAVFPMAYSITWAGCTARGAVSGAIIGVICSVSTWLIFAKVEYGEITIDTLGENYTMLTANLVAILSSGFISTAVSLIWKEPPCDWENTTMKIPLVETNDTQGTVYTTAESEEMDSGAKKVLWFGFGLSIVLVIVWPLLTLPAGVFSKPYWRFWTVLSIFWGVCATAAMVVLPIWESRETVIAVLTCGKIVPKRPDVEDQDFSVSGYHTKDLKEIKTETSLNVEGGVQVVTDIDGLSTGESKKV
eukprot:Awhi_evm1s3452